VGEKEIKKEVRKVERKRGSIENKLYKCRKKLQGETNGDKRTTNLEIKNNKALKSGR
jgi:hypothetical protein